MRLLVIDGNAPWVRSLFAAMPADVTVDLFRVYNGFDYIRRKIGPVRDALRWKEIDSRTRELLVLVPGWTRAYGPSSAVVQTAVRMFRRNPEPARAIIFTSPYYADVAKPLSAIPKYYLAHDPFRYYDWNAKQIALGRADAGRMRRFIANRTRTRGRFSNSIEKAHCVFTERRFD